MRLSKLQGLGLQSMNADASLEEGAQLVSLLVVEVLWKMSVDDVSQTSSISIEKWSFDHEK